MESFRFDWQLGGYSRNRVLGNATRPFACSTLAPFESFSYQKLALLDIPTKMLRRRSFSTKTTTTKAKLQLRPRAHTISREKDCEVEISSHFTLGDDTIYNDYNKTESDIMSDDAGVAYDMEIGVNIDSDTNILVRANVVDDYIKNIDEEIRSCVTAVDAVIDNHDHKPQKRNTHYSLDCVDSDLDSGLRLEDRPQPLKRRSIFSTPRKRPWKPARPSTPHFRLSKERGSLKLEESGGNFITKADPKYKIYRSEPICYHAFSTKSEYNSKPLRGIVLNSTSELRNSTRHPRRLSNKSQIRVLDDTEYEDESTLNITGRNMKKWPNGVGNLYCLHAKSRVFGAEYKRMSDMGLHEVNSLEALPGDEKNNSLSTHGRDSGTSPKVLLKIGDLGDREPTNPFMKTQISSTSKKTSIKNLIEATGVSASKKMPRNISSSTKFTYSTKDSIEASDFRISKKTATFHQTPGPALHESKVSSPSKARQFYGYTIPFSSQLVSSASSKSSASTSTNFQTKNLRPLMSFGPNCRVTEFSRSAAPSIEGADYDVLCIDSDDEKGLAELPVPKKHGLWCLWKTYKRGNKERNLWESERKQRLKRSHREQQERFADNSLLRPEVIEEVLIPTRLEQKRVRRWLRFDWMNRDPLGIGSW